MPRARPPHLHREKTRHGKTTWYVRVGGGKRVRLRQPYGTPEFDAEYLAAVNAGPAPASGKAPNGTLEWLIERYRDSDAWRNGLSKATRRQRENIFKHVIASAGRQRLSLITESKIAEGRDRRAGTPAQARNFLDAMRGLFRWALDADHVKRDPTAAVKNPKRKKGPGFKKWSEDEVDRYHKRWPLGTRQRVWIDVLLYTGLRRGDAVQIGKQHCRTELVDMIVDGATVKVELQVASIRTEKGGETITVTIPILPVLQATLDAGPCGDLAFICGARGGPLTKESFGNEFKEACRQAKVNEAKKAAHGLRKIGATRAAENGATGKQLDAMFGWVDGRTSEIYTREAERKRLALAAVGTISRNGTGTPPPAPLNEVRAGAKISK